MRRWNGFLASAAAWCLLGGSAPPAPRLGYADDVFGAAPPRVPVPPREAPRRPRLRYHLTVEFAAIADSNATNGTRLREVPVLSGDEQVPVPLDPRLRRKSGFGRSASLSGGVALPIAPMASLTASAEAYFTDYPGTISDDAWASLFAGAEFGREGSRTTIEAMLFDRVYAHRSVMAGWGLRASHREAIGNGQSLRLLVEGRVYGSGYGHAFDGKEAGLWLSYDAVLDPSLTASASLYVRRDALRDRAFASTETGGSAGLSFYLGPDLSGAASLGLARAWFDAPIPWLAADARADWRPFLGLSLTTRRPLLWGFSPSLAYSYGRSFSTLPLYESDRHRLRVGIARTFQ